MRKKTLSEEMMSTYPPSLAAKKKLKDFVDGFVFYKFNWLGDDPEEWQIMECTGAVFREAKSGKYKGQRRIKVKGTERKIYVTRSDINEESHNFITAWRKNES